MDLKKSAYLAPAILATALVVLNIVSRDKFSRLDLTDNDQFTLSISSRNVLDSIDDLLIMKVYFSDDLPGELGNTRRYLQDILEEYEAYGNNNVRFEFYAPESDEALEEDAQKSGIIPVQIQVVENDKIEVKKVFMGLSILYEDRREVLPVIQTTTGLEYDITTKIKKLVETNKQTVGLATLNGKSDQLENVQRLISERYLVRNIDLADPVPFNINLILVRGVTDTLSDSVKSNLEDFLARSGNMVLAQSRVNASLSTQQGTDIQSDIFEILDAYGLHLENNLVLDRVCSRVNVGRNMGMIRMNVPMEYPFLPLVRSFNEDEPLVSGLEQMLLFFPSEISIIDSLIPNVSVRPLFFEF